MKRLVVDSVYKLLDRFDEELSGLYEDLQELSKNRKYNFLEREAVLTADSYLDFIIERLTGFILRPDTPKDLVNRAEQLLDKAKEIRFFIYDNFEDVYRKSYPFQSQAG